MRSIYRRIKIHLESACDVHREKVKGQREAEELKPRRFVLRLVRLQSGARCSFEGSSSWPRAPPSEPWGGGASSLLPGRTNLKEKAKKPRKHEPSDSLGTERHDADGAWTWEWECLRSLADRQQGAAGPRSSPAASCSGLAARGEGTRITSCSEAAWGAVVFFSDASNRTYAATHSGVPQAYLGRRRVNRRVPTGVYE